MSKNYHNKTPSHKQTVKEKLIKFWDSITSCVNIEENEETSGFSHSQPHHQRTNAQDFSNAQDFCSLAGQLKAQMQAQNEKNGYILCKLVNKVGQNLGLDNEDCMGIVQEIDDFLS